MPEHSLTDEALALPLLERISLAQALWQSIDAGLPDTDGRAAIQDAIRRDTELSSGSVTGTPHDDVRFGGSAPHFSTKWTAPLQAFSWPLIVGPSSKPTFVAA